MNSSATLLEPAFAKRAVLSKQELADQLGISIRHLEKLVIGGVLPQPLRLGRCVRFLRSDIEAWLSAKRHGEGSREEYGSGRGQEHF